MVFFLLLTWMFVRAQFPNSIRHRPTSSSLLAAGQKPSFFFPASDANYGTKFYDSIENLPSVSWINGVAVMCQQNAATAYSELVNGLAGHLRIGFGVVVAANKDTSVATQSLQTLVGGGGNAMINFNYPLGYASGSYYTILWQFTPKIAGQLPIAGSYGAVSGNVAIGTDLYVDFFTSNGNLSLYGLIRAAEYVGTSDFYSNLNIPNSPFFLAQMNVGLQLTNSIRISVVLPVFSSNKSLTKIPAYIGTNILPAVQSKK
jgi:hypothetical protein